PAAGCRRPSPGSGWLRLFRRRELDRLLSAAGLRPIRAWGLHGITNLLPSIVLHRPRPPRGLAAAYRALCRLDAALTTTPPALAFANSLALLAVRSQPSA